MGLLSVRSGNFVMNLSFKIFVQPFENNLKDGKTVAVTASHMVLYT